MRSTRPTPPNSCAPAAPRPPGWPGCSRDGRSPSVDIALAEGRAQLTALDWPGVRAALDAHPRASASAWPVRARKRGGPSWSRPAAADSTRGATRAALVAANRAYEERFGHVFLIFATGRSDVEMLTAARERLNHNEATERGVVRAEIGPHRGAAAEPDVGRMTLSTHVLDTASGHRRGCRRAVGGSRDRGGRRSGGWREVAAGVTDVDGRLRDWVAADDWHAGALPPLLRHVDPRRPSSPRSRSPSSSPTRRATTTSRCC